MGENLVDLVVGLAGTSFKDTTFKKKFKHKLALILLYYMRQLCSMNKKRLN